MPSRMAKQISFLQDNSYLIQHNQFSSTLSELPLNRKAWAFFPKREGWGHLGDFLDLASGPGTALFGFKVLWSSSPGSPVTENHDRSINLSSSHLSFSPSLKTDSTAKEKKCSLVPLKTYIAEKNKKNKKKKKKHAFLLPIILDY